MKAQILKIAGVKSEKEFYKKYPSEAAFMKVHGKEFKKAQTGAAIKKAQNFGNLDASKLDANNNGILDAMENPGGFNSSMYGQTTNWSNTQGYNPSNANINNISGSGASYGTFAPGNYNSWDIDNDGIPDTMQKAEGNPLMNNNSSSTSPEKKEGSFDVPGLLNFTGGLINAGEGIKAAEDLTKHLETWADVSKVRKKAAISNAFVPIQPNQYYQPDALKNIFAANERYNTVGRGTDVLNVQNGSMIGGNPTEIQNMYSNEMTLYDDLGYEPLYESDDDYQLKAYQGGGGFGNILGGGSGGSGLFSGGTGGGSWLAGAMGGDSSYANAASMIPGPVGMFATMAARFFDKNPGKQRNAMNTINSNNRYINNIASGKFITRALSNSAVGQNGENLEMYEEGGYMNPEYNPQVITMFGDHTAEDFADYANKYRAGGHLKEYTEPSERAMETYAMGGKIQSHWGGNVEDVSYNPYMPGSGITSMIKGASHKNGGVGISYGGGEAQNGYGYAASGANMGAQIEAEGGESMIEMAEGGSVNPQTGEQDTNAVVIGNIPMNAQMAEATGDADLIEIAKQNPNTSMKKIFEQLTAEELKAQQDLKKASKLANDAQSPLDTKTAETIRTSAEAKLKMIANKKIKMAKYQDTLHKIKESVSQSRGKNISAEALGRGEIKDDLDPITKDAPIGNAKSGAYLRKAQGGTWIDQILDYESTKGSASGEGLPDFGIQKDKWEKKYPEYWKDGKINKEEAQDFIKKEFLPQVKDYPEDVQKRLIDYMYNTGRSANDLLLNATGNLDLDTMQTTSSNEDLWKKNKQKIIELSKDPNFVNQLDFAKANVMKDFWTRKGTPEVYDNTSKDRIFMWDKSKQTSQADNQNPVLTEAEYNELVKLYEEGASTKSGKSAAIKNFQRKYHQKFPQESLAAIQKTTRENGLSNKAKQMGLTEDDIASGKDVQKILESNEDEFWGPRTKQYMASINSAFNKRPAAPSLQTNTLGTPASTTGPAATDKKGIDVVPLKKNNLMDAMGMISQFFQRKNFPGMDQRQFAGEDMARALNVQQPVPMQKPYVELDPIYRMNYNDVRNANTAGFRDMLRQNQGNPAADALAFGRFAQQNQTIGGEEFRTNQAIEQQIYGGNRAKMNANLEKGLQLNANQANLQSIAKSKTDQTNIEIAKSRADKEMKYTADKNKFLTASNLFPKFGYSANYQTQVQGPGYNPTIPQLYGGKASIKQVPIYDTDGKTIIGYKMEEAGNSTDNTLAPWQTPPFVADIVNKKNGGKVKKNYKNSSVVRAYKNL